MTNFDIGAAAFGAIVEHGGRLSPNRSQLAFSYMRILLVIAVGLWLVPLQAEQATSSATNVPALRSQRGGLCDGNSAKECGVSKQDFTRARKAFEHALNLKSTHPQDALRYFDLAVGLVPGDVKYLSERALFVQQLVEDHIRRGNELLSQEKGDAATVEFRAALQLDSGNKSAAQLLHGASNAPATARPKNVEPEHEAGGKLLRPKAGTQTIHLMTDTQVAFNTIGTAFGVKVVFDSSTPNASVRLQLDEVTFEQAMNAVALVTHSFWAPISTDEVIVAADVTNKRAEFENWQKQTFYLPEISSPQELSEIGSLLKNLFEFRSISESTANSTITVRGPARMISAAAQFLETLRLERPEIMMDFEVYEISGQMLRDIGISLPSQFTIFNLPQSTFSVVVNGDAQQAIGQGIVSGSINETNGATIPALISQVQQQNSLTTIFPNSNTITFGGGKTRMGVQWPTLAASLSKNESRAVSLSKVTLRGSQGSVTTFRLGTRYPVIMGSYTAGTSSNGGALATTPITTYEDIGINIKATPALHKHDVTLKLDMEISSLGSVLFNGIPTIGQRSYSGVITVRDNEPAIVAASVSRSELRSIQGIPGIVNLPVLGSATSAHSTEVDEEEVLVIITPHSLTAPNKTDDRKTELLVPRN